MSEATDRTADEKGNEAYRVLVFVCRDVLLEGSTGPRFYMDWAVDQARACYELPADWKPRDYKQPIAGANCCEPVHPKATLSPGPPDGGCSETRPSERDMMGGAEDLPKVRCHLKDGYLWVACPESGSSYSFPVNISDDVRTPQGDTAIESVGVPEALAMISRWPKAVAAIKKEAGIE